MKIIFFGDSITKAGTLNKGYIDLLQNKINKGGNAVELIGAGINGNKVYDLYLRLEADVIDFNPDIVVIYVGINDVWHKMAGVGTEIEKFEEFYRAIIKKLQSKNIRVVLCTTSVIGEKPKKNTQDADLDAYSAVVTNLAKQLKCPLVDLRSAFKNYERSYNSKNKTAGILTTDGVHLNDKGNQLVAEEMFKILMPVGLG
ncbi:GDSL-type esterase/lipase family protein [Ferruginibacter paludis]|uniref:SGNH/GDSL hydrolase family protein n=1 Tax=Ferruginibacter paludis TaxID=1310417 RepID=UPI0025B45EEE|nr:GDSL-type esterase/lipase family protein [Ferruginibacter paludis]MDN3658767.1 GDSL-type esterase/lipase family protein [Ferruginibacter paludis]